MSNSVVTDWPSGSANTGWPQEPSAMLMPGRVQGWPAGTQRAANAAERLLSQAVAWWDVGQFRDGDRFLRNRGTGGELLDLRLGSAAVANSNDPRFLEPEDSGYTFLPGVASNSLNVGDSAALRVTGDIDIRVRVSMDDWTPGNNSTLAALWGGSGNRAIRFYVVTTGTLGLTVSSDGTAEALTALSTVTTGLADGSVKWVRVTRSAATGDVNFYLSDDDGLGTQLGATVSAATGNAYASTGGWWFGIRGAANSDALAGKVYRAIIKDGIDGTTVLDVDCDAITSGSATSFTAGTGQTVTINRSTSGRKAVAVPSRHKGGKPVMLFGTDDYLEVQDNWQHGLLNFAQGDSFTMLAFMRQWATPASFGGVISKKAGTSAVSAGYSIRANGTAYTYQTVYADGTTQITPASTSATTSGALNVLGAITDRTGRTITAVVGGATAGVSSMALGSLGSTTSLRIGRYGGVSTDYQDFEFYGAAIFRRALSPAELTLLSNYFTGRIA